MVLGPKLFSLDTWSWWTYWGL